MIGPFDHPWLGGLFADDEASVIWSPKRQIAHMLAFEAAYTRALGQVGKVEGAEGIAQKVEAFTPDIDALRQATARDGVVVPALIAQMKTEIGAEGIHSGATSQDVIDTALALTLRDNNTLLAGRITAVSTAFDALADRFGGRTIMGRTRMQAAMPITVKDRLVTWAAPIQAHGERLTTLRPAVEQLQLGGAAGDRAALGGQGDDIAAHMARELGLGAPAKAWHAMREGVVDYAGLLSLISGTLGKFGQDICLMAQQGIDEVTLAGGGGSSAMPHKQNPVLAELLVTLARFNATQLSGMHHALVHEQERSGAAWALEWMILPQMAQTTARSLSVAIEICEKITSIGSE